MWKDAQPKCTYHVCSKAWLVHFLITWPLACFWPCYSLNFGFVCLLEMKHFLTAVNSTLQHGCSSSTRLTTSKPAKWLLTKIEPWILHRDCRPWSSGTPGFSIYLVIFLDYMTWNKLEVSQQWNANRLSKAHHCGIWNTTGRDCKFTAGILDIKWCDSK